MILGKIRGSKTPSRRWRAREPGASSEVRAGRFRGREDEAGVVCSWWWFRVPRQIWTRGDPSLSPLHVKRLVLLCELVCAAETAWRRGVARLGLDLGVASLPTPTGRSAPFLKPRPDPHPRLASLPSFVAFEGTWDSFGYLAKALPLVPAAHLRVGTYTRTDGGITRVKRRTQNCVGKPHFLYCV